MDDSFKLKLLLSCLRITCQYFKGDEDECGLSLEYIPKDAEDYDCHIACNCDGDINQCDLPEKFQACL
jgi:hypothetical protein